MKKTSLILVTFFVFLAVILIPGCIKPEEVDKTDNGGSGDPSDSPLPGSRVGNTALDFTLQNQDGDYR